MKLFVISEDELLCMGLRFAGVDGVTVAGEAEFREILKRAIENPEIGMILVTESLAAQYEKEWLQAAGGKSQKLFLTLPMWKKKEGQRKPVGKPGVE